MGRSRGGSGGLAVIGILVIGTTACAPASRVAPTSTVAVSGVVDAPDGSPAAGVRVGLVKQLDAGELLGGLFAIGVSLGLACFGGGPHTPDVFAGQRSSVTDGGGRFRFQLGGGDTQGSFGRASTFSIVASLPAGPGELAGPATSEDLQLQATDLEVPALRLWRPPVRLTPAGASLRVDWPPPPAAYGGSPGYDVRFQDAGSLPVWVFSNSSAGATLDARLLEDSHGGAIVEARTQMPATGSTASLTYRSATVAYRGTAGAPPSRGRPCSVTRGGAIAGLTPCTLTDGDLNQPPLPTPAALPAPSGATPAPASPAHAQVDMGVPVPVSLVVVRGCPGCQVDGSTDATTWSPLGTVPADPGALEPPGGRATSRYVRVGSPGGLGSLRQISIWTTPRAAGTRPPGNGSASSPTIAAAPPAPASSPTDLRLLAAALFALAAAITALAVVLARRHAPT